MTSSLGEGLRAWILSGAALLVRSLTTLRTSVSSHVYHDIHGTRHQLLEIPICQKSCSSIDTSSRNHQWVRVEWVRSTRPTIRSSVVVWPLK